MPKLKGAADWLEKNSFIRILQHLGHLTILVAIISHWIGRGERRQGHEYQAWGVINAAHGKIGDRGRIGALEGLNENGVSLAGIELQRAWLLRAKLPKSNFRSADLSEARLDSSNLRKADLTAARLVHTSLVRVDLEGADLSGAVLDSVKATNAVFTRAKLSGARLAESHLLRADLREAELFEADLTRAGLESADLAGADLQRATLRGANLENANLARADLRDANLDALVNWRKIKSLEGARISGVLNPPEGFIAWAVDSMKAISDP